MSNLLRSELESFDITEADIGRCVVPYAVAIDIETELARAMRVVEAAITFTHYPQNYMHDVKLRMAVTEWEAGL